jgi:hypothetical protein
MRWEQYRRIFNNLPSAGSYFYCAAGSVGKVPIDHVVGVRAANADTNGVEVVTCVALFVPSDLIEIGLERSFCDAQEEV